MVPHGAHLRRGVLLLIISAAVVPGCRLAGKIESRPRNGSRSGPESPGACSDFGFGILANKTEAEVKQTSKFSKMWMRLREAGVAYREPAAVKMIWFQGEGDHTKSGCHMPAAA